jgi:type VI secretion system Hcp family effector
MSSVAKLYMKLTGKAQGWIKGESETEYFEDQIEIDDWSWSVQTRTASTSSGSASRPGGASSSAEGSTTEPSIFSFGKLMDSATTNMLTAMQSGELMEAEITLQEMSRGSFELKVVLYEVRVVDYGLNGKLDKSSGEIDETWQFNYSRIKFDFKPTARRDGAVAGVMTVDATRSSLASNKAPDTPSEEMMKLAGKLNVADWSALMPRLVNCQKEAR